MSDFSVSLEQTVTHRHFKSLAVSFAMSSPIFFGDRPGGPVITKSDMPALISAKPVLIFSHHHHLCRSFKNGRLHQRQTGLQAGSQSCRKSGHPDSIVPSIRTSRVALTQSCRKSGHPESPSTQLCRKSGHPESPSTLPCRINIRTSRLYRAVLISGHPESTSF